jgi:hypothetical protein
MVFNVLGMRICKGNRNGSRDPTPMPFYPRKILRNWGLNLDRSGGKQANNCPNYGTVKACKDYMHSDMDCAF